MSTTSLPITSVDDLPQDVLEGVVVGGDLSKLTARQRLAWYRARCDAAGLDPRTQPFQYMTLQGKLSLYATKAATDQLISGRKLTTEIVNRRHDPELGIYEVQCRVTFADGRHVEDFAAVAVTGLKGDALCNALMKCVTKAKRRTVLSACGLGMLDESETETIPGASRVEIALHQDPQLPPPDNASGYGRGQYASPEQVEAYSLAIRDFVDAKNAQWLDEWTGDEGLADGIGELLRTPQMTGHLLKWGLRTGRLQPVDMTWDHETGKPVERVSVEKAKKYVAILYAREPEALQEEAEAYARAEAAEARKAWAAKHGEVGEDADADLETTEAGTRG